MLRNPVLGKDNVYRNFVSVSFRMPAKRGAKRGGKRGVRKRVVAKARRAPVRRRKKLKVRLKILKANSIRQEVALGRGIKLASKHYKSTRLNTK